MNCILVSCNNKTQEKSLLVLLSLPWALMNQIFSRFKRKEKKPPQQNQNKMGTGSGKYYMYNQCSGIWVNGLLNVLLYFKSNRLPVDDSPTCKGQIMHLVNQLIHSHAQVKAHSSPGASIAICKKSWTPETAARHGKWLAWDQAHFLHLFTTMLLIILYSTLVS